MGKHNPKSRKKGLKVGQALLNKRHQQSTSHQSRYDQSGDASARHTTELNDSSAPGANTQSIIEMNDLDELMNMAALAERDFTAERCEPVVIQLGASERAQMTPEERAKLEEDHRHRLTVPRRPAWTRETTAEELDTQERASFLDWRRTIAVAEEETGLSVTPFEKNLEVWRQLWRVLERSHVVAQVVDARNPLFYYCEDLKNYALAIVPPKETVLILNKSDLLPAAHRRAWAAYFKDRGIKFCFFSAKLEDPNPAKRPVAAEEAEAAESADAADAAGACEDEADIKVHSREEMIDRLGDFAVESLKAADVADPRLNTSAHNPRLSVGLVGFPNVGKSSTINALMGEKKTVVSSTPGKTKHFQTLNVSDDVMICDCPGLVFPRFADSRASMVVSGVLPIEKLANDVRAPLNIIASHFRKEYLSRFYHVTLESEEGLPSWRVSGKQLAEAYAVVRGLILMGGRADEMKSGRKILKDYIDGKLCYCHPPPGVAHLKQRNEILLEEAKLEAGKTERAQGSGGQGGEEEEEEAVVQRLNGFTELGSGASNGGNAAARFDGKKRPDYKFKKNRKNKKGVNAQSHVQSDGGLAIGRKGGVIRISSNY